MKLIIYSDASCCVDLAVAVSYISAK